MKVEHMAGHNAVGSYPWNRTDPFPGVLSLILEWSCFPPFVETRLFRHRSNADKICVVEDGRVVETGKHDELIKIPGGKYFQLVKLQMGTGTDG